MEAFSICIAKEVYHVTPKENEIYLIETQNGRPFYLIPFLLDSGINWSLLKGDATLDVVQSIGASFFS